MCVLERKIVSQQRMAMVCLVPHGGGGKCENQGGLVTFAIPHNSRTAKVEQNKPNVLRCVCFVQQICQPHSLTQLSSAVIFFHSFASVLTSVFTNNHPKFPIFSVASQCLFHLMNELCSLRWCQRRIHNTHTCHHNTL